ncbi:MAG: SagB/ThcOx family dehydrogenase [bacterium]|nr:SagB/ThcOx family dehydrogenase [bacterium]
MAEEIRLPSPLKEGMVSLEETIAKRRSVRSFLPKALKIEDLSMLLWVGQGETAPYSRAVPSAGATFPLELYVLIGKDGIIGIPPGLYQYHPKGHFITPEIQEDLRRPLSSACLDQSFIEEAPISLIITALPSRTTSHYGERGIRYVYMEVGHAGQNIALQAVALNLGTVMVGAFEDKGVAKVLRLDKEEKPLYIIPVGIPRI